MMARSWRDYLAEKEDAAAHDNRDNSDNRPPIVAIVPNVMDSSIQSGVLRVKAMPTPRGADRAAWQCAVKDAAKLLDEGWVASALGLGWTPLDLFGGQLKRSGDPYADGLAVWLQGRRVLAITADHAIASDANGGRHFFNRPRAPGASLMWALGNGR